MEPCDTPERLQNLVRLPMRRVFDTADYPRPAGVRRREDGSRHLLYQAGKLCLDLRLERDPQSPHTVLVGQLADSGNPLKTRAAVPIFVLSGEEVVARTTSNSMGEFQLEVELRRGMALCVPVAEDQLIEVPLAAPASDDQG